MKKSLNLTAALLATSLLGAFLATCFPPTAVMASRNSSGTYSLPAGNPVVTGTTISSTWANSTLSDLGTELTNSLDRNGRGAMLAPLQCYSGSVTAPGLTWSAETGSGLYRAGLHDFRMSVNQADVEKWTTSGVAITGTATISGGIPNGLTVTQSTLNQPGLTVTGNGTGAGVSATGGTTGPGGSFSAGTAATATTYQDALAVPNGDLNLDGAANPNSNVGFKNRLTPKNVLKAWGNATTNGAGGVTLNDGFNVSAVAISGNNVSVTLTTALANSSYAVVTNANGITGWCGPSNSSSSVFLISCSTVSGGVASQINLGNIASIVHFAVYGAQ